jgi:hypothetical protein
VETEATPNKSVTVMVSNFGQSELLVNFVCAAKSRNYDIYFVHFGMCTNGFGDQNIGGKFGIDGLLL